MFQLFKRKPTTPEWKDLDNAQKVAVARKITKAVKAMSGPRYKIVSGTDEWQREAGVTETTEEDEILGAYGRFKMLDLARNAARNSSTMQSILHQLQTNVIGTKGGKACFNFDGADNIKRVFSDWTRQAEFFDGQSLNTCLRLIYSTYILGGDCVLIFDDGIIEDSGKLLIYEPDMIGDVSAEELKKHYGANAKQSLGRVYSPTGRFQGAIVSRHERGKEIFDGDYCYFLHKEPDASIFDSFWTMPRNVFRAAQGRGISPLTASLGTIIDLEDYCGFEIAAAKKNAQTLAQVLQDGTASNDSVSAPSAFDAGTDFSSMTDEEIEKAVQAEAATREVTMTLDKVNAAGAIYQIMPQGYRLDLLDTKHPNQNTPDFIKWLAGRAAGPLGLSQTWATLQADGNSFKAEQILTWPSFYEGQKFLEQNVLDWVLVRWARWAERKGIITNVPADFIRHVSWDFPRMLDTDENAAQDAIAKKLKNMTASYQDVLGPSWKETLLTVKNEMDWMKANGLPHLAFETVCGAVRGDETTNE